MGHGPIKTSEEIALLREGGKRLAQVLVELAEMVAPGISIGELDGRARQLFAAAGGDPAFLGYQPAGASRPFPAAVCVSVNEEVVHGIPNEDARIIEEGDIVSIDAGLRYKGLITDSAISVGVGKMHAEDRTLMDVTKESLAVGIAAARAGEPISAIGDAIEAFVRSRPRRYGLVWELGGHGVGYRVHEPPFVPNVARSGVRDIMKPGMVLALEPMLNLGTAEVDLMPDGYTFVTRDRKKSAHFEHTIVVTEDDAEILTRVDG